MKEKLTNNFGLKLLSLFLAYVFWAAVINSQDPRETVTFENVPVSVLNEDSLTAKDKIPEILEGETITVVIEARRSICDSLTKADIVAVADFEKISVADSVPIEVSVRGYTEPDVEIIRGQNQFMKLSLDESLSKDFRVKIATSGVPASGYVTGDMSASPNVITLTGSSTQINNIKEVVMVVDITGISNERQVYGTPVIYDMNGDVVSNSKVTMSTPSIKVNIPVLKTKNVKINVVTTGTPAEGYEVSNISYQPQSVQVAGTAVELLMLGTEIKAYCDVTGATGVIEENFDISALWDNELTSLRLVDEEELAVTVTLKGYEEKVMELSIEDIELYGLQEGLKAEIVKLGQNQVRVRGNQSKLMETTLEKLAPYIDLSEYEKPGYHVVYLCYNGNLSGLLVQDMMIRVEVRISAVEPETPVDGNLTETYGDTERGDASESTGN